MNMRSRGLIGGLGIAALALAGWIAWDRQAGADAAVAAAGVARPGVLPRPAEGAADTPGTSAEAAARRSAEGTAETGMAAEEAAGPASDPAEHLRVRVVERPSGAPVPGAEILWAEVDPSDLVRARDLARVDELLAADGQSLVADEKGLARLPWSRERALVIAARSGELWGSRLAYTSTGEELLLELAPDYAVDVLVRARGRSAEGLAVALRRERWYRMDNIVVAHTDAEGRARLPHVGAAIARMGDEQSFALWIAAAIPLAEPVRAPLDPAAPPTEPVVLELPATGSLEVRVRTFDGAPPPPGSVELARLASPEERARAGFLRGTTESPTSTRLEGSVARFPAVGVGLDLRATVRVEGAAVATEKELAGPGSAGQQASVEVVLGSDHPLLRVRVLDEAHAPLSDVELVTRVEGQRGELWESHPRAQVRRLRTAANGTLDLHLPRDAEAQPGRTLTLLVAEDAGREPSEARIDISRAFADGLHELGDVVLRPAPLLASGRVVDGEGAPLAGARLRGFTAGASSRDSQDLGVTARSDDEGRFELRAACGTPEVRVSASAPGRVYADLRCTRGAEDLELVLERTGSLAGGLRSDGTLPLSALLVRAVRKSGLPGEVEPGDGLALRPTHGTAVPRADGSFLLETLAPGTYDLSVTARGAEDALATLTGLVVPAGGACDDPRLASIEVRGGPRRVRVDLVASEPGTPIRGHYAWRVAGGTSFNVMWLESRRIELVGADTFDLRVHVLDHRAVQIDGLASDRTVHLERGFPVRLKLPAGLRLPEPPLALKASLSDPRNDSHGMGHFGAPAFDARGELSMLAEAAGTLQVSFALERVEEHSWTSWHVGGTKQEVTVLETWREQLFELDLTQEALDEAIEKIR